MPVGDLLLRELEVLLNHTVRHRGQLSVYLRLLNIPLPATYGTSADEVAEAGPPADSTWG
jgi:uncharacterized damage-inducible protein DinB